MADLSLANLEIKNFRAFHHLRIEKLGRVNLIVGKNNVGKTSFLEAIKLFAYMGSPSVIWEILESRNENVYSINLSKTDPEASDTVVKNLFYGREEIPYGQPSEVISITRLNPNIGGVTIRLNWYTAEYNYTNAKSLISNSNYKIQEGLITNELRFEIGIGGKQRVAYNITPVDERKRFTLGNKSIHCVYISSNSLQKNEVANFWDTVALTDKETTVIDALHVIMPQIERINFIGEQGTRVPIVKLAGLQNPVPLRSLGDGMSRIFGITLALTNSQDGFLLIDEFENGLHYSIQYDLWKLIFQVARQLNVQVFATTHSWDCIEAFTKAAIEDKQDEGMLIRLTNNEGDIVATVFDENELGIATREQIEVR